MGLVDNDDGVCANDFFQRGANGIRQIQAGAVLHLFDEVRQDFSVCFALQVVPAVRQKAANGLMVFNDAIVNDGNAAAASCVRMGVDIAGRAMCCPSGVANAHCAHRRVLVQMRFQIGNLPLFFFNPEHLVGLKGGDAGAVVPSVFESFQTIQQNRVSFLFADVSNDSTHA